MKEQLRWWLYKLVCFALGVDSLGRQAPGYEEYFDEYQVYIVGWTDKEKHGNK